MQVFVYSGEYAQNKKIMEAAVMAHGWQCKACEERQDTEGAHCGCPGFVPLNSVEALAFLMVSLMFASAVLALQANAWLSFRSGA
jgi:hypothetical protein